MLKIIDISNAVKIINKACSIEDNVVLQIELPPSQVESLEEELYKSINGRLYGFSSADEVDFTIDNTIIKIIKQKNEKK